jgi:hypothetical protein
MPTTNPDDLLPAGADYGDIWERGELLARDPHCRARCRGLQCS